MCPNANPNHNANSSLNPNPKHNAWQNEAMEIDQMGVWYEGVQIEEWGSPYIKQPFTHYCYLVVWPLEVEV